MNSSGASASTANQDRTSVSFSLIGCHWRMEMNGSTSSDSATRGQLCTKDRFGNTEAAEIMKPSSPTTLSWSSERVSFIRSTISCGYPT
ncbi:MAG: hypothetical protein JWQ26_126 [Modestobacter sp.]|nr:hypothetical protein [Modestobacter sp.]